MLLLPRILFTLVGVCALVALLITPLGWQEQAIAGGALIGGAILLAWVSSAATVTIALMIISMFSSLRYAYWRATETWDGVTSAGHLLQWDTVFVVLLLFAEFYAVATLALGYFQTLRPLRRRPVRLSGPQSSWPTVDVLIPTYNEPLEVVRATILGALALDYPKDRMKVIVLDDGRRPEFRDFAARIGVGYLTRTTNAHAKAGNINHALTRTRGEYVAIFDCDHVPTLSFLQMTLGWFVRDPALGLVQTPHHFYSPDPFERNLGQFRKVPNEGELFHRLVQDGNDLWNASFFCGSCAVLRRRALDEIGGIAVETVTEDAHTALRMQRRGWNTAYINIPQAAGLATESLAAHIGQRIRWARGMVQILRIENPLFVSGLSLSQRLCYLNATTHFLFAVPRLIFLTIPLTYLLFGMVNIYGYSLAVFAYALPHVVLSHVTNTRIQKRHRSSFWNEIYEAVLAPYILFPTVLALINPKLGKFNVTGKGGIINRSYFDHRVALPFMFLLGLNVAGLVMAAQRYATDQAHHDTIIMNTVWTIYNIVILSVAASVAREKRQRRADVRVDARVPLTVLTAEGRGATGATADLSLRGATVCLDSPLRLQLGSVVKLVLEERGSRCEIAARVMDAERREMHVMFPRLNVSQEQYLVGAMYSRPDAWLGWEADRPADSLLRSLFRVCWLSVRGIGIVLLACVTPPGLHRRAGDPSGRRRRRAAAATASALIAALLAGSPTSALAQSAGSAVARPAEPSMFRDAYALGDIAGQGEHELSGTGATLNYFFGVPVTKIISQATLELRYAAPLLAAQEGRLDFSLNGTQVGSLALVPGSDMRAQILLPTDLLTTDNTLSMRIEGRCAACTQSRAPWATVDPSSTLGISGTRLPLANDLALLPIPFFDQTSQRSWRLPVVFSDPPDPVEVKAAAMVASWFGVASDVRGVRFPVSVGELPQGNAVVLARRGSALDLSLSLPSQPRTIVAIRDNPHDPYGKLLILAGDGPPDLLAAARVLVTADLSRRRTDVVEVQGVSVPVRGEYEAPRWLATDRPAAIGLYTSAERMRLTGSGSVNVYFRLPPDLFLAVQQSVPLRLKFGYSGVTEGAQAAVHVRLNDRDVDSIRLKPTSTPLEREEVVRLPTGSLRPYTNTLTIDVDFGRRGRPSEGSQFAAIRRESFIDLRGVPHAVVLPRLELFAEAGYPFTQWPDLSRTAVVLSKAPTPIEYEVLLNMAGFFGAQTGSAATALTVTDAPSTELLRDKDIVVLGTPASQPLLLEWASSMPLAVSTETLRPSDAPGPSRWRYPHWPFRDGDRDRLVTMLRADARFDVILEHFVSPFRPDRSVVAIVPGESRPETASGLFMPSSERGPVYGGLAVARDGRFQSFLLGAAAYHSGRHDTYQRVRVLFVEYYWLAPPFVFLVAMVFGRRLYVGTERLAARRLAVGKI